MSRDYYVLADLMYGDSEALPRFLDGRRKHKNVFAGTFEFICGACPSRCARSPTA